jgi:hypothetical protein
MKDEGKTIASAVLLGAMAAAVVAVLERLVLGQHHWGLPAIGALAATAAVIRVAEKKTG